MSGFFALLDDIATLAKLTLSTLDDTASMAVKTTAKVSAAAVDDVAFEPRGQLVEIDGQGSQRRWHPG